MSKSLEPYGLYSVNHKIGKIFVIDCESAD